MATEELEAFAMGEHEDGSDFELEEQGKIIDKRTLLLLTPLLDAS